MSRKIRIGDARALEQGLGVSFEFINRADIDASIKGFAVSSGGRVYAYANRCPHLGVELDWTPGEFFDREARYLVCSTHGARFEPETGLCVAGPCSGQSLSPLRVSVEEGEIYFHDDPAADF